MLTFWKEVFILKRINSFFVCALITLVIWTISRFVPGMVGALFPNGVVMSITALTALPVGWIAADRISKGRFSRCVCANLYIFAVIEAFGILESLTYVLQNWSFTGRYTSDVNGIAYSDYFVIFGGMILFEIVYVVLCVALAKSTKTESEKVCGSVTGGEVAEQAPDGFDTTGNEIPNTEVQVMEKTFKQRYCKYCGGAIDHDTKKCTKCGKQYLRTRRVATILVIVTFVLSFGVSLFFNAYQYQRNQIITFQLNEQISELQKSLKNEEKSRKNAENLVVKLEKNSQKADLYDHICRYMDSGNIGYAANNFCSSESIIVVRKGEQDRKFTLTANWPSGGDVYVNYSSNVASVSFDNDSWRTSTQMTIEPKRAGVTVVTFSNSVDSKTFKILIIVTE